MGVITLVYGAIVYLLFLGAFLYLIVFVGGDMTAFAGAPKTLDWGTSPLAGAPPALVNIGLLLLFGVQHTIMARQGFKKGLTKIISWPVERSTFVLITVILLALIYICWIPMPGVVWSVESSIWSGLLTGLFLVGFATVLVSTYLINHFELFGLMQVWYRFKNKQMPEPTFHTPLLYQHVRHPLYLGFMTAFWATPHMTVSHLLFASVWTIYIFVAIGYEERDLIHLFGDQYRAYMAKTPMILPFGKRKD